MLKPSAPAIPWWVLLIIFILSLLGTQSWVVVALFGPIMSHFGKTRDRDNLKKQLRRDFESICSTGKASELYQFFMRVLSFVFNQPINDLTEQLIEQLLLEKGFEQEKVQEFVHYLNQCASLSFSSARHQQGEHQEILKRAQYWFLMVHETKQWDENCYEHDENNYNEHCYWK